MSLQVPQGGGTRLYGHRAGPAQPGPGSQPLPAGHDYDFVIGSIHNIRGCEDFFLFGSFPGGARLYRRPADHLLGGGAGGHRLGGSLTPWAIYPPLRYIEGGPRHPGGPLQASRGHRRHFPGAGLIPGKALEVNTSACARRLAVPAGPAPWRRYRELGGELVTWARTPIARKTWARALKRAWTCCGGGIPPFAVYEQHKLHFAAAAVIGSFHGWIGSYRPKS